MATPSRQQIAEPLAASRQAVEAIVRRALAVSFGGEADVPSEVVAAVAEGRGDRHIVRDAMQRGSSAGGAPLELAVFDTDHIASYVFESSRPPVIAGASRLLRDLNAEIARKYSHCTLYSGGGEGLLLVPAGQGAEIGRFIEELYLQQTAGALGVTTAWIPVLPEDFVAGSPAEAEGASGVRLVSGTQAVLSRLRDAVRRKKDEQAPRREAVDGGLRRCASCRDRAGDREPPIRRTPREYICGPCFQRWEAGRGVIDGISFEDVVDDFAQAIRQGEVEGSKARDLGFLYTDGNGMGALFGRLDSLAELRFLSRAVSHVFEGLHLRVVDLVRRATGLLDDGPKPPLVSLLAGGDEAIWIAPAAVALEAAFHLPTWLAEEERRVDGLQALLRRKQSQQLTVGVGLVLCDHSFPVRYQYDLAKALLRSAKRCFYEGIEDHRESGLDFAVLTTGSPMSESLTDARAVTYGTEEEGFLRTCRPYRARDFTTLRQRYGQAKAAGMARSQLYGLQHGAVEGKAIFLNYLRYQLGRSGEAAERYRTWLKHAGANAQDPAAVERFFVQPLDSPARAGTWIPDALELGPYLDLQDRWED